MRASLSFPRLLTQQLETSFLIDTGAQVSIIHPNDLAPLGIDVDLDFDDAPIARARGIGGRVTYAMDAVHLELRHEDGDLFSYILPVRVAKPTTDNAHFPSILGTDFLQHFRLVIDYGHNVVELH